MAEPSALVDDAPRGEAGRVAVRLAGVRKRFADVVAADGVDLDVYRGEFFSLLGPSGWARRPACE